YRRQKLKIHTVCIFRRLGLSSRSCFFSILFFISLANYHCKHHPCTSVEKESRNIRKCSCKNPTYGINNSGKSIQSISSLLWTFSFSGLFYPASLSRPPGST